VNVRRSAAGLTLGLALAVSGASAAFAADPTYPPTTPSPTTSGVVVSTDAPSVADTSAEVVESDALPRTGTDVLEWSLAGLGLVAAGAALVVVTRRRGVRA
jgi:LPXTG-motif cell wall-anchored protein